MCRHCLAPYTQCVYIRTASADPPTQFPRMSTMYGEFGMCSNRCPTQSLYALCPTRVWRCCCIAARPRRHSGSTPITWCRSTIFASVIVPTHLRPGIASCIYCDTQAFQAMSRIDGPCPAAETWASFVSFSCGHLYSQVCAPRLCSVTD